MMNVNNEPAMNNFGGGQAPVGPDPNQAPAWLKILARAVGIFCGLLAIILGFLMMFSFKAICIGAAIIQVIGGIMVLVLEASFIFVCAPPLQKFATYMSEKPTWYKAALYLALGIPSILMCFQLLSIFGSGCIFVTGVFYAAVALGKKAPLEDMRAAAQPTDKRDLVNEGDPTPY